MLKDMEQCSKQLHDIRNLFKLQTGQISVICLPCTHFLHRPKKFRQRFSLSYIYTSSKWYSQHLLNFGRVKKCIKLWDVSTDRKLTPTVIGTDTRKPKGWESREKLKRFFSQFMNLVWWDLQTHLQRCISSNWHLSLPLLAGPASVPCSTVPQTGITWRKETVFLIRQ